MLENTLLQPLDNKKKKKDSIASTLYCNNQVIPIASSSLGGSSCPYT